MATCSYTGNETCLFLFSVPCGLCGSESRSINPETGVEFTADEILAKIREFHRSNNADSCTEPA